MQISRLIRGRLPSSVRTLLREVSSPSCRISDNSSLNFEGFGRGHCAYRLFCSTSTHKNANLATWKQFQPIFQISRRNCGVKKIVGLTFATSCLAAGMSLQAKCEEVQMGELASPMPDGVIKVDERNSGILIVLKYLWMPMIALFTVISGYYFPSSLAVTVCLLLWSSKPKPNSIYDWVEKRRLEEAMEKQRIEKFGFNLNLKPAVMHVEVRDYTLICLAQVTSMTQNATLVGLLGGWLVIYSSSSSITALGLRPYFPDSFPALKKYLTDLIPELS